MFILRSSFQAPRVRRPYQTCHSKYISSCRLKSSKIAELYAVDSNNNLIRLVQEESVLAHHIINTPSEKLRKIIDKLVNVAQKMLLHDAEGKYYNCMVKAMYPRNQNIAAAIRKNYHLKARQEIDQQIFNLWIHQALKSKEERAPNKMLIFGGIGELSIGAEEWLKNLNVLRTQGPHDPSPRLKRPTVAASTYYGIYAKENSSEAPVKPKEYQIINGIAFWQINEGNSFVKNIRKKGFPLIAGPSGNMGPFLNFAHDAKLEDDEFEAFADYAAASLVHEGHHAFVEAVVSSNVFFRRKGIEQRKIDNYYTLLGKEVQQSYASFMPKML